MNIVYIITKADEIGGAQIHIRDLCHRLKNEGNNVTVIVGETGALVDQLNEFGVPVLIVKSLKREISLFFDIMAIWNVRSLIKHLKPDLISLHSSKAGIIGRLASMRLNIPVIFTAHGWAFANGVGSKQKKIYCFLEKIMAPLATRIITVSEQDKKLALNFKVAPENKQIVIHNGMPEINCSFIEKKTASADDSVIKLISVARFSEQKDHQTLFLSLKELMDYEWTLQLVGKGPFINKYRDLSIELGISDRVEFLGERHDVAELLYYSDIFLLISNWEGFPRSILEAMRAGIPVIASNVGGTSESVINNETGFLIERGDVNQLTKKLKILFEDKQLRLKMGRAGQYSFTKNFTFESMFNKTKQLYKSIISSPQ